MPEIVVWEEPRPQQRHRTGQGREYTPTPTLEAQHRIREAWRAAGLPRFEGPVEIVITVYLARPKGHYGTGRNAGVVKRSAPVYPCGARNDWDNFGKLASDALAGVAFGDDGSVVDGTVRKRYVEPGSVWSPRWWIIVEPKELAWTS